MATDFSSYGKVFGMRPEEYVWSDVESKEEFIERLVRELPEVLIKCEGNVGFIAWLYDVPQKHIDAMVKTFPSINEAFRKGIDLARLGVKKDAEIAKALYDLAKKEYKEPEKEKKIRTNWPTNDADRLKALISYIPDAIMQCNGSITKMAEALTRPIEEIELALDMVDGSAEMIEKAREILKSKVKDRMDDELLTGKSSTPRLQYLKSHEQSWQDKSEVTVKNTGFDQSEVKEDKKGNVLDRFKVVQGTKE